MDHSKEQIKSKEADPKETEIHKLVDKQFKVTITEMFNELR